MIFDGEFYIEDLQYLAKNSVNKNIEFLIKALVLQIEESEEAQWCLTKWSDDNENPFFNIRAITSLQRHGYNIYRLRPLGSAKLNRYRILYAYDNEYDDFYLLAVIEKPPENETETINHNRVCSNYENDHDIIKRICDEYDRFHIPKIIKH